MITAREHYDREYAEGVYGQNYAQLPDWAKAMNLWHVDFVTALLGLRPDGGPILDLGSGMGHYLEAWASRGFEVRGREISGVAAAKSPLRRLIDVGDGTDLSEYADGQFQLVFSAAFLEHVTDEQVLRLLEHQARVARYAAHFIAHEQGGDPGHINIKTPDEWIAYFGEHSPRSSLKVPNPFAPVQPAFIFMGELPPHIQHFVECYYRSES